MGDFTTGAIYSPDGNAAPVLVVAERQTPTCTSRKRTDRGVRRITDSRGIDISASWSPDGKRGRLRL